MVELLKKRKKPAKKTVKTKAKPKAKPKSSVSQVVRQTVIVNQVPKPRAKRAKTSNSGGGVARVGSTGGTFFTKGQPPPPTVDPALLMILSKFVSKDPSMDRSPINGEKQTDIPPPRTNEITAQQAAQEALVDDQQRQENKQQIQNAIRGRPQNRGGKGRRRTNSEPPMATAVNVPPGQMVTRTGLQQLFGGEFKATKFRSKNPTKDTTILNPSVPAPTLPPPASLPFGVENSGEPAMGGGSNKFTETLRDIKERSPASEMPSPVTSPKRKPLASPKPKPPPKVEVMKSPEPKKGAAAEEMTSTELKRGAAEDEFKDAESGSDDEDEKRDTLLKKLNATPGGSKSTDTLFIERRSMNNELKEKIGKFDVDIIESVNKAVVNFKNLSIEERKFMSSIREELNKASRVAKTKAKAEAAAKK